MNGKIISQDIAAVFKRAESVKPGKPFLLMDRKVITYGVLLDRIGRLTSLFAKNGLMAGDRLIIATRDDEEAIILFLASLLNGVTAVMLDPRSPAPSAQTVIEEIGARGIVLDEDLHALWRPSAHAFVFRINKTTGPSNRLLGKLLRKREIVHDGEDYYPSNLEGLVPSMPADTIDPDLDAYIMFTSGTTSRPKGVQISHLNLCSHLDTLSRQFGYGAKSRILNVLPLHHADGLVQGPLAAFWNCATLSRPMRFAIANIQSLLDKVYAERITHFVAVPTILSMILQFGHGYEDTFITEDFLFIISAAAKLEETLWKSFEQRFRTRIVNVYGLTETVTGGLFCGPDDTTRKIGTIGKPVDCEAIVADADGRGLPEGETGELLIRGPNVMKGYFNDPLATASVLRSGWLYTGDFAVKDTDGFYLIVGRKKNIIITGGVNVQPEEVTEILNSHPDVIEAVTFGLEDETWGELVVSCVVTNGNGSSDVHLIEFCRSRLSPEKVPARIHIMPYLPKGPSGKVIVTEVRCLVPESESSAVTTYTSDASELILNLAAACFKVPVDRLSAGARPSDTPGWDSLAHLEFVVAVEKSFGIRLSPLDIIRIECLHDAFAIVDEKRRHNQ